MKLKYFLLVTLIHLVIIYPYGPKQISPKISFRNGKDSLTITITPENNISKNKNRDMKKKKIKLKDKVTKTELNGITSKVKTISLLHPKYPPISRRRGESGKIIINAIINKIGQVIKTSIIVSTGFYRLDQAAIRALNDGVFTPAYKNGVAIQSSKTVTFNFVIK